PRRRAAFGRSGHRLQQREQPQAPPADPDHRRRDEEHLMSPLRAQVVRSDSERNAERGSAYLFVLLGLLVLTIIGLSLVVVTQTESEIGGAEKTATRILYGAESGLHGQVGLHFLELSPTDGQFQVATTTAAETITAMKETVDVSPFYPIYAGP